MKYIKILIPAILLSLVVLYGCKLSAARSMAGTWKTPSAVTFYYYSAGCGAYTKVAKLEMSMTWKITKKSDNEVDIEWRSDHTSAPQSIITPSCNMYIPIVTPKFLTGIISASQMDIYEDNQQVGTLSFTADNLTGFYYYGNECYLYCTGVGTNSAIPHATIDKTLILQRQ